MLKTIYRTLIFAELFFFFSAPLFAQNVSDTFALDSYKVWHNSTEYTRTYVVNQRHPDANDDNPGTEDKPLLTINKAAQLVKPGERVLIYSGVYRETIRPLQGGLNDSKMISYESAPGEEVIIKGSRMLDTEWIQRRVKTDVIENTTLTYTWSRKT